MKISCESLRDHALLQFLYATGCRIGEVHRLNVEDINWENGSAIVNGKGSKQREVYFTTECKVWLKKYLDTRKDNCEALFVTHRNPVRRMTIPTLRLAVKLIAARGQVHVNVYPHRFRHTYACQLLDNVHHLILFRECWDTKRHPQHKFMLSYVENVEENFINGFSRSHEASIVLNGRILQ